MDDRIHVAQKTEKRSSVIATPLLGIQPKATKSLYERVNHSPMFIAAQCTITKYGFNLNNHQLISGERILLSHKECAIMTFTKNGHSWRSLC